MMYQFVVDPAMGLRSRTKRPAGGEMSFYGHYSCVANKAIEQFFDTIGQMFGAKKID
jgi:hypothetical protein